MRRQYYPGYQAKHKTKIAGQRERAEKAYHDVSDFAVLATR